MEKKIKKLSVKKPSKKKKQQHTLPPSIQCQE